MNDNRFEAIDTFLTVLRLGNFGLAGRELGVSQSTVSRRVARLEARLGVRLLARTTRALDVTPAGHAFAEEARLALSMLDQAEARVAAATSDVAGVLRVTMPTGLGRAILAPALARSLRRYPRLRLQLDLTDRYRDLVADGVDLAIRLTDDSPSGWDCEALGVLGGQLCAAPDYLAGHPAPHTPLDLLSHDLLVTQTYTPRTRWSLRHEGRLHRLDILPRVTVSDYGALAELARAGAGIAILPDYLSGPLLTSGALLELLPGSVVGGPTAYALTPRHLRQAGALRAMLEDIRAAFKPDPAAASMWGTSPFEQRPARKRTGIGSSETTMNANRDAL